MPITSYYNIGTVNVTNGSTTVECIGGAWTGAGIRDGDMFWCEGLSVRISSLTDNTHLELYSPWPGENGAGRSYEVQYTPDASRVMTQTSELLDAMGKGGVAPLKNIVPENNRIAVYTGTNTAKVVPVTTLSVEILALTTVAAILTKLGIGFPASRYDGTADKVLKTGSFGLGSISLEALPNLDVTTTPTCFATIVTASVQGTKPTDTGVNDALLNIRITGNTVIQVYFSTHSTSPVYYRVSTGANTWVAWKKFVFE